MNNITQLINKYYTPDGYNRTANPRQTKAEKTTPNYNKRMKQEQYRKNRHLILDQLINETPFTLDKNQITQIRYWIDKFNTEFKAFHRNSSNETILLAFIMIQRKQHYPKTQVEKYRISNKYNLNNSTFELIQNRLIFKLMQSLPLIYSQAKYVNHEIIEK